MAEEIEKQGEDVAKQVEDKPKNSQQIKSGNSENLVLDLYFGQAEKTEQRSAWVAETYQAPYNPDEVYQKSGDYSIYEDMKNDDQVSVAMQLKKDLILGSGWDIETSKEGDSDLAETIYSRLDEDSERSLDDMLDDYLDALYSYGFAVAEKRFAKRSDGSLTFRSLTTRHPNSWLLHTDTHGNISKYEQHGASKDLDINPKSLMYSTIGNSLVGPYGKSDLRAAHDAWFIKRHIVRFYSIFLEKAASPIPVARYDKNLPDAKVTTLASIIKNFQTKTALTIPKEIEIEFLETSNQGDTYTKGINLFNMFIGRSLLVPDLLGFTGEGSGSGGSQALGREQVEIFFKHINRRRRSIERLVNRHIIYPMVVYNSGFQENYPKFKLKPISEDNATDYAKTFIEAMRGKMYKPTVEEINHFRDLIKFPEGEVEFVEPAPTPRGPFGGGADDELDGNRKNFPEDGDDTTGDGDVKASAGGSSSETKDKRVSSKVGKRGPRGGLIVGTTKGGKPIYGRPDDIKNTEKEFNFNKIEGDYSKKTDFKAIESKLDSSEKMLGKEIRPLVEEIFADLYEQMRKKKIVNGPDSKPERIPTIKLKKLSALQKLFKKHFLQIYKDQNTIARAELFKQDFAQVVPADTYFDWLETASFQYVGDWEYNVTRGAAVEMQNAISDGRPISSVIEIVDDTGKRDSMVSTERYSRTKFTEITNMARMRAFEDAQVVQGYQYSAILDGRTTVVCSGLHGKTFKMGDAPLPPLHFNCRSILIPITIFEEFTPDTKPNREMETRRGGKRVTIPVPNMSQNLPDFIKTHGGKGFVDKSGVGKK